MAEHHIEPDRGEGVRLFCDLSVLDAAQRKRRFVLHQLPQVGTVDLVELPDGYAFHVDSASIVAQYLEEFAALERLCCPFVTLAVRAGMAGAQPVLEMRGRDAVKEFIAAEFGIRKRRSP